MTPRHTPAGDSYLVPAGFDECRAFLRVVDLGPGLETTPSSIAEDGAESGRGVVLLEALMDSVRFESWIGDGTRVILEKRRTFLPGALAEQLRQPTA